MEPRRMCLSICSARRNRPTVTVVVRRPSVVGDVFCASCFEEQLKKRRMRASFLRRTFLSGAFRCLRHSDSHSSRVGEQQSQILNSQATETVGTNRGTK